MKEEEVLGTRIGLTSFLGCRIWERWKCVGTGADKNLQHKDISTQRVGKINGLVAQITPWLEDNFYIELN